MAQNILIIDDDAMLRSFTAELLKFNGYAVSQLGDANELVPYVRSEKIDLILIDYHLPGIDGLLALRNLRSKHMTLPVIVMTADVSPRLILQCFRAGADEFICKPFDEEYLTLIVERTLDRASISLKNTIFRLMGYARHRDGCEPQDEESCACGLQEAFRMAAEATRMIKQK